MVEWKTNMYQFRITNIFQVGSNGSHCNVEYSKDNWNTKHKFGPLLTEAAEQLIGKMSNEFTVSKTDDDGVVYSIDVDHSRSFLIKEYGILEITQQEAIALMSNLKRVIDE